MGIFNSLPDQPVDAAAANALNQKLLTPAEFSQQFPSLVPDEEGGMKYNTDIPSYESYFNSLPDSIKQTPAYTNQKAELAAGTLFNDFIANGRTSPLFPNGQQEVSDAKSYLASIKDTNPDAYWGQTLSLNLQKAGWDAGQGKTNDETNATIQDALKKAQAAGVSQENINNLIKINYEGMAKSHAENIAQRQGQGAFLQGIEKVAPAFAAMITAGALAPEAAALEAASAASTVAPEIAGSGFYTGTGFGAEGIGTAAPAAIAEGSTVAEDELYKKFLDAFQNPEISNLPAYESTSSIPTSDIPNPDLISKDVAYDPMQASQEGYDLQKYDPMQASQEGFDYTPKYDPMQASQEGYTLPDNVAKEPLSMLEKISNIPSNAIDYLRNTPLSEIGSDLYSSVAANPLTWGAGTLGVAGLVGAGPLAGIGKVVGTASKDTTPSTTSTPTTQETKYKYGSAGKTAANYLLRNRINAGNIYSSAAGYHPLTRMADGGEVKHFGGGGIADQFTKVFQPLEKAVVQPIGQAAPFLKDIAPYAGMIAAPFIASPLAAAGVGALASGIGQGGFNMKRALMGGISAYGLSNLGGGLEAAGSITPAADISGSVPDTTNNFFRSPEAMVHGVENLTAGGNSYDVAAKNFATKAGLPSAAMTIMGQAGVGAVNEGIKQQAAADQALSQSNSTNDEMNAKIKAARDRAFAAMHEHPYMYAMGGMIPNPPDDQTGIINQTPMQNFEHGGVLGYAMGGYAMGGEPRFLSGGGDGMSDSIHANIEGNQEARLADGEFVIPADVVSGLGNGSSKAGAKQLYSMMDRIRQARTGTKKQGKQINPQKFMSV
jgi:hypothetical protein